MHWGRDALEGGGDVRAMGCWKSGSERLLSVTNAVGEGSWGERGWDTSSDHRNVGGWGVITPRFNASPWCTHKYSHT